MATVAEHAVLAVLAAAEVYRAAFVGLVLDRTEFAALMRAVAERLGLALSAGAPPVDLSVFDDDGIGGFLCDFGRGHGVAP